MVEPTRDSMTLSDAVRRLSDSERPQDGSLSSDERTRDYSWDLNTTFTQARELATKGWEEQARKLEKLIRSLAPQVEYGLSSQYDVTGESVDVGRMLSGEPECMLSQNVPTKNITKVVVNISARSSAPAEYLANRGAAIAAVIQSLQSNGQGVQLIATELVSKWNDSGPQHETNIELERYGDYINLGRLAFWLSHPAALRRCVFRYNEQQSREVRQTFGFYSDRGYGYPRDHKPDEFGPDTVYIPFPETSELGAYRTAEGALNRIVEYFKEKKIPVTVSMSSRHSSE